MQTLLQIPWRVRQWKNYENRPISDEVIVKIKRCAFFRHSVHVVYLNWVPPKWRRTWSNLRVQLGSQPYESVNMEVAIRPSAGHVQQWVSGFHPLPLNKIQLCGSLMSVHWTPLLKTNLDFLIYEKPVTRGRTNHYCSLSSSFVRANSCVF